jgi:hypothetical protein
MGEASAAPTSAGAGMAATARTLRREAMAESLNCILKSIVLDNAYSSELLQLLYNDSPSGSHYHRHHGNPPHGETKSAVGSEFDCAKEINEGIFESASSIFRREPANLWK